MKVTVHGSDGRFLELDHVPSLPEAQKIVGGYIELVHPRISPGKTLIVNEDGHPLGLPPNEVGTQLYGGPIVGDIIVIDGVVVDLALK